MPVPLPLSKQHLLSDPFQALWGRTALATSVLVAIKVWPLSLSFREAFFQFAYEFCHLEQAHLEFFQKLPIKLLEIYGYFFSRYILTATVSFAAGLLLSYLLRMCWCQTVPSLGSLLRFLLELSLFPCIGHGFLFGLVLVLSNFLQMIGWAESSI